MSPVDVRDDIQGNLIPNAVAVPAQVTEISRFQERGYTLVYVPPYLG
jgi:hypothetical protein